MKRRNQFLKYQMFSNVPEGAGGGGGTGGAQPPADGGEDKNKSGNNAPDYGNLWAMDDDDGGSPANGGQPQNPGNDIDPEEAMSKHLSKLKLTDGLDPNSIIQDLNSGNTESFMKAFETVAANAYKAALSDSNKLIDARLAQSEEKVTSRARGDFQSTMLVADMHEKLPYTSAPELEPIAKAVLTRFMKKGKSPQDAIKEVDNFFNHVSTKISGTSGAPDNTPGSRGFRGRNSQGTGEPDWLDILGGSSDD